MGLKVQKNKKKTPRYIGHRGVLPHKVLRSLMYVYINRKIILRAGDTHHKILLLLKGHFPKNKKPSSVCKAEQWHMVSLIHIRGHATVIF